MKLKILGMQIIATVACLDAYAAVTYQIEIRNAGVMPISPSVVYAKVGQSSGAAVGSEPTPGFIRLCQTGNPADRAAELHAQSGVKSVLQTEGPILPGQAKTVEVTLANPTKESIQFEAMYGKSKDVCATATIGSHGLYALKQHVVSDLISKDNVVQTGAFLDATIPSEHVNAQGSDTVYVCPGADSAVACLRELALPNPERAQIRFFSDYLPTLLQKLELKYGAADVATLRIPTAGALQLTVKLKH